MVVTCSILTSSGMRIAADSHRFRPILIADKIDTFGIFKVRCNIPKNLFNKGHFILFFNSNSKDEEGKNWTINPFFTLELEVQNNPWEENVFYSNFTTPLQPFLDWKIIKTI